MGSSSITEPSASTTAAPSNSNSSESLNGLKFGQKIYFENMGGGGGAPAKSNGGGASSSLSKKGRGCGVQGAQPPRCQVEGCKVDLSDAKAYYSRHKVCNMHSKSPTVLVAGQQQRFCQQCSRSPLPIFLFLFLSSSSSSLFSFLFLFLFSLDSVSYLFLSLYNVLVPHPLLPTSFFYSYTILTSYCSSFPSRRFSSLLFAVLFYYLSFDGGCVFCYRHDHYKLVSSDAWGG